MTVGQRIAQKRKELGLSQEELGAHLGVSRQAIYKWESDQSLPEVEKLVTLSRLFSVTVGWLLGVEEEPAPQTEAELTEAQLKMVQEIADRYIAAMPAPEAPPPRKRRKWPFVLAGLAVIWCLWSLFSQLSSLSNQYNTLQYSISSVTDSVNRQIGGIANRVESILESQNALVADWSAEVAGMDIPANTVTFDVRAVPKTFEEDMTAIFVLESDGERFETPVEPNADHTFTALPTCPLSDNIRLSVVFLTPDGRRQTQLLDQYSGLYSNTFPFVSITFALCPFEIKKDTAPAKDIRHDAWWWDDTSALEMTELRMGLFKDQELVMWYEPVEVTVFNANGSAQSTELRYRRPETTLERGHIYCEAIVITDEYGRERVYADTPLEYNENRGEWQWVNGFSYDHSPEGWTY